MSFVIKYLNDETIAEIDYMYHITYKDRLSSVINTWSNGTTTSLTYSTSNRFKTSKITKAGVESNLVWDGNNLVQYGNYKLLKEKVNEFLEFKELNSLIVHSLISRIEVGYRDNPMTIKIYYKFINDSITN